jgi:hypothetical protein
MGFLDFLSPIIGVGSSIAGLIGGNAQQQAAQQAAQQATSQYGTALDNQYLGLLSGNNQTLNSEAGQGADALRQYGSTMGAANAAAGVYNSSATAGDLAMANRNEQNALANTAAQNYRNANQMYNQGQENLASMKLGQANTLYNQSNAQYNQSLGGLTSSLGSLGTYLGSQVPSGQTNPIASETGPLTATNWQGPTNAANPNPLSRQVGIPSYSPQMLGMMASLASPGSASSIGSANQSNLASTGANSARVGMAPMNGTINQGANLGGNAGYAPPQINMSRYPGLYGR